MKLKSITYISFALNKISICSQFTLPCPWIKLFVYCRSIVAFRHGHNFNFNCSDIYIVVALTPISEEIKFDEKEISKCQWMPIEVTIRFLIKNIQMIKKKTSMTIWLFWRNMPPVHWFMIQTDILLRSLWNATRLEHSLVLRRFNWN